MLTTIFYVWISGFAIFETYTLYEVVTNPPTRVISSGEALAIGTVASALWPAIVTFHAVEKVKSFGKN